MPSKFLQLHFLTSYPASLLNRDDAGFAKRIPFGGAVRTRVSSQCQKRHWRTHRGVHSLDDIDVAPSIRSRLTFERYVFKPLVEEDGFDEDVATKATEALMDLVLGKSASRRASEQDEASELRSAQITVLGHPEVNYLRKLGREICEEADGQKGVAKAVKERFDREAKKNLEALDHAAGLDAALFGRMVTSDVLARGDAAVHVAHAFTVHEEATESDYFSAVDDLLDTEEGEELGSGHINTAELTSGLFYGYVVADVPLLVSNLEGCDAEDWLDADRELAGEVVEHLVHLVATVSPGAKLGSTAPYAYAHLVLAEAGDTQPRTLANAFLKPVSSRPDLVANAYQALNDHLMELDQMYGTETRRKASGLGPVDRLKGGLQSTEPVPLPTLAGWAADAVTG